MHRPFGYVRAARLLASLGVTLALVFACLAPGALAQSPAPLTLTLAIANDQGEPSQPAIDAFIEQVATLSNGSIVIDPLYGAGNATSEGFEAGVAGLVERGEADLALNASRAWDLEGVTSLQALQAPFLITDGALAVAVATSDIATRALAGMADKGVTGLTLWPEDLRHPFALGTHPPFLSPADFKGANILVQPSALSRSLITTLGGTLYVDGDREADAAAGILQGAESGLLQGATLPGHPTATGDVTFYPKFQVISANAAKLAGLTSEQQDILRAAAAETQRLTIAAHTSEADAAAAWCANGGTVVLAGPSGVATFEAAAKPVFDVISKDPLTATLIKDIVALKATTTPAPGASACNAVAASPSPVAANVIPDGTYTTIATKEDALRTGWQDDCALLRDGNHLKLVLEGGKFTQLSGCQGVPENVGDEGTYTSTADRLVLTSDSGPSAVTMAWALVGDVLTLHVLDAPDPLAVAQFLYEHDWTRVP